MELERQVAHLLRERGETYPAPLIGGVVVETRADDRVNVYWRVPGRLALGFLRLRSLRRYERILAGFGMATTLHEQGPEPYLTCWVREQRRSWMGAGGGVRAPETLTPTASAAAAASAAAEILREAALSR